MPIFPQKFGAVKRSLCIFCIYLVAEKQNLRLMCTYILAFGKNLCIFCEYFGPQKKCLHKFCTCFSAAGEKLCMFFTSFWLLKRKLHIFCTFLGLLKKNSLIMHFLGVAEKKCVQILEHVTQKAKFS